MFVKSQVVILIQVCHLEIDINLTSQRRIYNLIITLFLSICRGKAIKKKKRRSIRESGETCWHEMGIS